MEWPGRIGSAEEIQPGKGGVGHGAARGQDKSAKNQAPAPATAERPGAAGLEQGQVGPHPRANTKIKF